MKIGELFRGRAATAADYRERMLAEAKASFGHIDRTDEEYLALLASCYKRQRDELMALAEKAGLVPPKVA